MIAEVQLGKMLSAKARSGSGARPYLRNVNVRWGRVDVTDLLRMDFTEEEAKKFALRSGDVLVCEGGEPGRAAVWRGEMDEVLYQKALHRIRGLANGLRPEYLAYHLEFDASSGRLTRYFTGSTIKHFTREALLGYSVRLAPRVEQDRIVAEIDAQLSRLESAVAGLKRVQENLKRYRAAVLKAACEGRLVPTEAKLARRERREYEPAEALLERVEQQKHRRTAAPAIGGDVGELPEGWVQVTIDDMAEAVDYGTSAKTAADTDGIPVLRMGNIAGGAIVPNELKYLSSKHPEFPRLLLSSGDILFNRTNSAELVGKSAVYEGHPTPCSFASYLIRVRIISGVNSRYVSYVLNSPYGRQWISSVVSQQVGQANVSGSKLRAFVIPLPPTAEQARIVDAVDQRLSAIRRAMNEAERAIRRAERLRQSILKRAFEGKLVPQDPSDEPASVLLERIRAERGSQSTVKRKRRAAAAADK
jgi:type I restriction enzyme S subunit